MEKILNEFDAIQAKNDNVIAGIKDGQPKVLFKKGYLNEMEKEMIRHILKDEDGKDTLLRVAINIIDRKLPFNDAFMRVLVEDGLVEIVNVAQPEPKHPIDDPTHFMYN